MSQSLPAYGFIHEDCPICQSKGYVSVGEKNSRLLPSHIFKFMRCNSCDFAYVQNPILDYARIYNMDYYKGCGLDPSVNYFHELNNPKYTVRNYEWQGISQVITSLLKPYQKTLSQCKMLDYGCGSGGLVRYLKTVHGADSYGYDQSPILETVKSQGIAILDQEGLKNYKGQFDVISAIEVIEHHPKPIELLKELRTLLKPDGLLYITTGNLRHSPKDVSNWAYASHPDVHISFFSPSSLARVLKESGFNVQYPGYLPGHSNILKFRILKTLKQKTSYRLLNFIPWQIITRIIEKTYGLSEMPFGVAEKKS